MQCSSRSGSSNGVFRLRLGTKSTTGSVSHAKNAGSLAGYIGMTGFKIRIIRDFFDTFSSIIHR